MIVYDHWHIEPTSVCVLKCPRCTRNEVPETLLNKSLDLDFFQNQIGEDIVKQIRKITFCGNDGDPIYCPELAEIVQWIKTVNPTLTINLITNGSYRKTDWWTKLAQAMNEHDEITWSLDGWDQHSNEQYRMESDWASIISGIETFCANNTKTYKIWASIGFAFNENHFDKHLDLANNYNFDLYQLTKSTKFGAKYPDIYGPDDPLEPTNADLIPNGYRYQRRYQNLTKRDRPSDTLAELFKKRALQLKEQGMYSALCMVGNKGVFLNSQGEFYPCCWVATRYEHNREWNARASSQFNLHNRKFTEIINDSYWNTDFLKFDNMECYTKCIPEKLIDVKHITEW